MVTVKICQGLNAVIHLLLSPSWGSPAWLRYELPKLGIVGVSIFLACIQMYERLYTKIRCLYTNPRLGVHIVYKFVYKSLKSSTEKCEVRDLNPRSRAWEARTLTGLG